jgi:hypothetical protein
LSVYIYKRYSVINEKNANTTEEKQTNELLYRLYEDCVKFKREKGKKVNCDYYSEITNNTPSEKKRQDVQFNRS